MRHPPRGTVVAGPSDLASLVAQAERAAPDRTRGYEPRAVNPRDDVRFGVAGRRLRLHPGDHVHPQVLLRAASATAAAIDPILLELRGFTLTDVMEVVLGHADRMTSTLAGVWAAQSDGAEPEAVTDPAISDVEIAVTREQMFIDPASLAGACRHAARAATALAWLTRPASDLKLAATAINPVLGATLLVDRGAQRIAVPAALTLGTLAAATGLLADEATAASPQAHHRLQALTQWRVVRLFMGCTAGPVTVEIADEGANEETRWAEQASKVDSGAGVAADAPASSGNPGGRVRQPLVMRGSRHVMVTVCGLGSGYLSRALSWAEDRLTAESCIADNESSSGAGAPTKVVIYGGPAILAYQEVTDTVRLHIEEVAEILADAQGDQALFASFIAELCDPHRDSTVLVFDMLDAWSLWRAHGFLPLSGDSEPDPVQADDLAWRKAVAWEPFEQILFDAGLPASVDWPIARLDDDMCGAALFAGGDRVALLVRRNPDMLVCVFFDDADQLGMSHDGLYGFADGLLTTLGRQPTISAHVQLGQETPLHLVLRLLTERTPEGHEGIRFGVAMAPDRGVVEIALGPDTVELFQGDGHDGHRLLGGILHEAVARLRAARGDDPGSPADEFQTAWDSCPPVMTFAFVESSAPTMPQPNTFPRGPYLRARALRAVAVTLRERDLPVGSIAGDQAREVCRDRLLPVLEEVLRSRIRACQPDLLAHALRGLNAAHATRYSEQLTLARSLAGPFADNWIEHALRAQEGAAATRPLEILFEFILAHPPRGRQPVDVLEVADLAALADLLLTVATRVRGADRNLHDLTVHITDGGVFAFDDDIDPANTDFAGLGFDHHAYSRAHREQQVALAQTTRPGEPRPFRHMSIGEANQSPMPFTSLREVADAGLVQADHQFRVSFGTSLDAIRAVLHVACDWPVSDGFSQVEPSELAAETAAWSGLPATEIDAAIRILQLTREDLAPMDGAMIADVEGRAHRLALRPLPLVDGHLLIAPWLAHTALRVYATYLGESRLPYPRESLPDHVERLMEQRRQQQNYQLEAQVRAVVAELGLPHRFQFDQRDAAEAGIPDLPGEIDLLIADPGHNRLWVCEVKDPQAAYSPAAIARHIRLFTKRDRHIDKLLNKADVILNHAAAAASACEETTSRPWRVVPLMVTRWVEPTAFIANPRVPFTVPDQLASVLGTHHAPAPGPAVTAHE